MKKTNILVFAFFLLFTALNLHAQKEKIDELFAEFDNQNSPGLAIAVVKNGKIDYMKGYGMANLEYDIPIVQNSIFHVASLSKQFTAFAILKLEEEGLLSLDDDVRKYIPELPNFGKKITLKNLANHSSGLREQWRLLEMAGWRLDDVITTENVLKLISRQQSLNFNPGERFTYCNTGFTLLATVVERITKKTFAQYTKEQIFDPLQMTNSFFYDNHETIVPNRAYSYKKTNKSLVKSRLNFSTVGPTSLFTTVEDMTKWALNFDQLTIGSSSIFSKMREQGKLKNGRSVSYALGQFVDEYYGHKMISHSGSDAGYRSYFARFPEDNLAIIVFANASYINARQQAYKVLNLYFNIPTSRNANQSSKPKVFEYDTKQFVKLNNKELKKYEGTYFFEEERFYRKVYLKNDTLRYSRGDKDESKLIPIGKGSFKLLGTTYDVSVNFKENNFSEPILEYYIPDVMWLWMPKTENTPPEKYLGTYYSEELNTSFQVVKRGNQFVLEHRRLKDIPIDQINNLFFSSSNRNFRSMRFSQDKEKNIVNFSVTNDGVKSLEFTKQSDK